MSGSVVIAGAYLGDGGTGYAVVATGDFNGDGVADVAWANTTSIKIWINNGAGRYSASSAIGYGGGWAPFDPGQG